MKDDNSKMNSNSNNIIKEKLSKLGIKPINYPVIEEKMKNAMNLNKNNHENSNINTNNNNQKKEEENHQNNNMDIIRDTSINSNAYSFNRKGKLKYSLFLFRFWKNMLKYFLILILR